MRVSAQTPGCLGNPQRKVPVIGHPCCRVHSPAADPLISGNKGGRASNSSKIASRVGGVEGCSGGLRGWRGRSEEGLVLRLILHALIAVK